MNDASWIGVAMAALALLGTVANMVATAVAGITARKMAADKLQFDAKLTVLEAQHEDCQEQHEETKHDLAECKEHHLATSSGIADLAARVNAVESKVQNVEAKIA